jgi:xanthine dehydrogenase YagS FAD-binding subunit
MRPFAYERAADQPAAIRRVAGDPAARYLAGGTNLVDLMRLGVAGPDLLVDVSALLSHDVEVRADGSLLVGAGVSNSDLAADPVVRRDHPVLSQALLAGASGQLRNLATVGGNLLQRTRCVYFTDPSKPCNKREPGTGCPARTGVHRDLAVLGASEQCIATSPSDMAVALAALDALVHVSGPAGDRVVPLVELHRLPGEDPSRDTVLEHGDLITAVELPPASPLSRRSAYRKARDRASYAFALASVAAAVDVRDGVVHDVRLAFGALAHKPWRATTAEAAMRGGPATAEAFTAAVDAELAAAEPLTDNAFKVPLARNLAVSVLSELTDPTGEDGR